MTKKIIIGISGASCTGKTTFSRILSAKLKKLFNVRSLSFDDYYLDLSFLPEEERNKRNFDHPNALDDDLFYEHLLLFKKNLAFSKPIYDFRTHTRIGKEEIKNKFDILICEGILFHHFKKLRELSNLNIYLELDDDVILARRIQRDERERGRDVDFIISQYFNTVKPMFLSFVKPQKQWADIIVNTFDKESLIFNIIFNHISCLFNE